MSGEEILRDPSVVTVLGALNKEITIDEDMLTKGYAYGLIALPRVVVY